MKTRYTLVPILFFCLISVLSFAPFEAVQAQEKENSESQTLLLEEFADLQCPSCRYQHFIVKRLKEDFREQLEVKYYHFPLSMHQYAIPAARATEAARKQGKFMEYKDVLYERQHEWPTSGFQSYFIDYAKELDLDVAQFKKDLNSQAAQQRVKEDKEEGQSRGVRATPTFFVNGKEIKYPTSYEEFKQVLQQKLKAATSN